MPGSRIGTAVLRAMSQDERRKKVVRTYEREGTLERTAATLGCTIRFLSRLRAEDPALDRAMTRLHRNGVTPLRP